MVAKLVTKLLVGDSIIDSVGNAKEVTKTEIALPECLAETEVFFKDGTRERFCNWKNLEVKEKIK